MLADLAANWPMIVSVIVVIGAIYFYTRDKYPMELVSITVLCVLLVVFYFQEFIPHRGESLSPEELLSGFGNPALITIMALLVVGQGLFQTGALDGPSRFMMSSYDARPFLTLIAAFTAVFVTSAFINNTPVVVMFLPIMAAFAEKMRLSPSKLMQPLSFISVFAGMTTLIGTSTNLLAADIYRSTEGVSLGFFELAPVGLILAAAGVIYMVFASRFLLPNREGLEASLVSRSGRQFIAQIAVTEGNPLVGQTAIAGMFPDLAEMTVRMIQRGESSFLPPFDDVTLQAGDMLIVAATRKTLTDTLASQPDLLRQMWQAKDGATDEDGNTTPRLLLIEAVVAPGSRMIGRAIEQLGFRRLTNTLVLGVQRRSRMIRARLGDIRLEAGDTLLLCGPSASFKDLRVSRDLLLLEWSQVELPVTEKSHISRIITLGLVIAAATGALDILHASVLGAVAMIITGCLNIRQAARSLDLRIFTLIAAAIAMGMALDKSGAALTLAQGVVDLVSPFGTLAVLSILFLLVAVMTNVLSNSATAVLFTPIAISAAKLLGVDPKPFVLAVIYAANCCFATPIAYQTNLLVMGPGHYRFMDYLKFGGPLVIVIWIAFTVIAPFRFSL
ncbi:MAG: SLC13 family permease [Ponticaulis sp.]|nr:SLC13 family permease [Ponticaulis sp.]|tara:strand:- start:20916 stop:22760 length:1845 start_codon:yes stop_codon:yes gene_type:complete